MCRLGRVLRPPLGVLDAVDSEAAVHQAAVLRLQAVGDALLYLVAAAQESAAVSSKLLPGAPAVLLLLTTAGKELLHIITETNLFGWSTALGTAGPEGAGVFREAAVQPFLSLCLPIFRWSCRGMVGGMKGGLLGSGRSLRGHSCPKWGLEVQGAVGVGGAAEGAPQVDALSFVRLAGRGGVLPDILVRGRGGGGCKRGGGELRGGGRGRWGGGEGGGVRDGPGWAAASVKPGREVSGVVGVQTLTQGAPQAVGLPVDITV